MSDFHSLAISGATITVDPWAFAPTTISKCSMPEPHTFGIKIDGGKVFSVRDVPHGPLFGAFFGVADAYASIPHNSDRTWSACAEFLHQYRIVEATTITQVAKAKAEAINSVPLLGDYLPAPSTIGQRAIVSAMNNAGGRAIEKWKINAGNRATFTYVQKQGIVEISIDPGAGEVYAELAKLNNDETIDVFFILLAHHAERQNRDGYSEIATTTILQERDLKPKISKDEAKSYTEGYRVEDYCTIAEHVAQLDKIWIRLRDVEVVKGREKRRLTQKSKCLIITDRVEEARDNGLPPRILGWRYTFGEALKALGGDRQFGYLARQVLAYHPRRKMPEKRLARYFAFLHRIQRTRPVRCSIAILVEQCNLNINTRNPQQSKDRIERALNCLKADGVIGSWRYVESGILPARNWLPHWLRWSVEVTIAPGNPLWKLVEKSG